MVSSSRRRSASVFDTRKAMRFAAFVKMAAAVSRDRLRRLALQEFLDSYFESSREELLRFLQGEPRVIPQVATLSLSNALDPALL